MMCSGPRVLEISFQAVAGMNAPLDSAIFPVRQKWSNSRVRPFAFDGCH